MRIAVDVRALKDNSGVTRHLKTFLDKLQLIDQENEYYLLSNRKITYKIFNSKWKLISNYSFIPGTMWIQLFLPFQIKKLKIDLFWAACQICPVTKLKCKIILSVYDLVYKHYPETMKYSVRIISQSLIPLSMKRANAIIVSSGFIKNDILETYKDKIAKEKIVIIPCGSPEWVVDEQTNRLSQENYFLFVGNLEPRKNLLRVTEALEILYNKGIEIPLHLVGPSGWENSAFFKKISNSLINKQITILGYLKESQLIEQYCKAKAVIFPSLYEGFGLPILESLYLNKTVITSKGTVMQEIARETAVYVDPFDPFDIADKMQKVYENKNDCTNQDKKVICEKYNWLKSVEILYSQFKFVNNGF